MNLLNKPIFRVALGLTAVVLLLAGMRWHANPGPAAADQPNAGPATATQGAAPSITQPDQKAVGGAGDLLLSTGIGVRVDGYQYAQDQQLLKIAVTIANQRKESISVSPDNFSLGRMDEPGLSPTYLAAQNALSRVTVPPGEAKSGIVAFPGTDATNVTLLFTYSSSNESPSSVNIALLP